MTGARSLGWVGPAYLFACLTLGGSAQGIWTNVALQLVAIGMLTWVFAFGRPDADPVERRLSWLVGIGVGLVALQLMPLPPALWSALPGRNAVVDGFGLIGMALPWMPFSMAPEATISAMLALLPPLAMLFWILRGPRQRWTWLVVATLAAAAISIVVALWQAGSDAPWYPYRHSSLGAATGLFANSNHLASLMLCAVPLLAAIGADLLGNRDSKKAGQRAAIAAALALCAAALVGGILLNGSLAVVLLGGPMLLASALLLLPASAARAAWGMVVAGCVALVVASALVASGTISLERWSGHASIAERLEILRASSVLAGAYSPWGSGFGTFPAVYRLFEDPRAVDWIFVNHVHNDLLELVIETGVAGVVWIAALLWWWADRAIYHWRSPAGSAAAKAFTLVSSGLLLHSLVDFPLRTPGLAALFTTALAVMASRATPASGPKPRHLTINDI